MPAINEILETVAQLKSNLRIDSCIICGREPVIRNVAAIKLAKFQWSICAKNSCWKRVRNPRKKRKRWALKIANRLLRKHGLARGYGRWQVMVLDLVDAENNLSHLGTPYQIAGLCVPSKRIIILNTWLLALKSKHCIKQTMYHEMAHAKLERGNKIKHGHDEYWQERAKSMGYLYADRYSNKTSEEI